MSNFTITAEDLQWLNDSAGDPDDLCLHSHAVALIDKTNPKKL